MTITHIQEPVHVLFGDTSSRILRGCDAVVLEDSLARGPCHLDPVRHAQQRRAYWRATVEAPSPMPARLRREFIASLTTSIFSARELTAALATFPEDQPVLLWTAPLWGERLSLWWTLDALRQGGVNPERFWVAEPHVAYSNSGAPQDTSLCNINDERLAQAFADRRPLHRGLLRSGAAMWRRYAASSPRAFDAARRQGNLHFPDLPIIAELHGMFFPRVVGSRSTTLRLSAIDQIFFNQIQTDAWVRPIDMLRNIRSLGEFLCLVGDTFLPDRLRALAGHCPENPLLLSRQIKEGVNHLTRVAYQLTPHGVRVRDRGLDRAGDVPPLFVGGCEVYAGNRPWARRLTGTRWRIERLDPIA